MDVYQETSGNTYGVESFEFENEFEENEILESEEALTVEKEESDLTMELTDSDSFTESQTVSETNFKEEALETIPLSEEMTSLEETVSLEETSPVQEIASTFEQERESILSKEESQEGTSLETSTEASESKSADERNQMDLLLVSQEDMNSSLEWQEQLVSCNSSLSSCVSLLLFGDILLCLLLGCLCTSIFSRFWKVNR